MSDIDHDEDFKGDPFFEIIHDSEWEATIDRQGDEENYLGVYIETAIELADSNVEKRLYIKCDTSGGALTGEARCLQRVLSRCSDGYRLL